MEGGQLSVPLTGGGDLRFEACNGFGGDDFQAATPLPLLEVVAVWVRDAKLAQWISAKKKGDPPRGRAAKAAEKPAAAEEEAEGLAALDELLGDDGGLRPPKRPR